MFDTNAISIILLTEVKLTLVSLNIVNFEVGFGKLGDEAVPGLRPLSTLKQVLPLSQISHR